MMATSPVGIDRLEKSWDELQLHVEEEQRLLIEESSTATENFDPRWCLVGRLLSDRTIDFGAFKNVMAALWRPVKGLGVKDLDHNWYLFQFWHEMDISRVLDGSPWTFNRIPLLLCRLKEGDDPQEIVVNSLEVWVQVFDLKAGFKSDVVLKACGDFIGKFLYSCPKNYSGIWKDYLRIRVQISVDQPLRRRLKIGRGHQDWFWANFKYERIPTFCFVCGILGHSEKFFPKVFEENYVDEGKPYGMFMRALDRRQQRQIGARWLRDDFDQPTSVGGASGTRSSPTHLPVSPGPIGMGTKVQSTGELHCFDGKRVENSETHSLDAEFNFIDLKRRRVLDGLGLLQSCLFLVNLGLLCTEGFWTRAVVCCMWT